MNRLSIDKSVRETARTDAGQSSVPGNEQTTANLHQARSLWRLRHPVAGQYDWMDHHPSFEASEW